MLEGTWGFVSWEDVTSDIVQGERATFYFLLAQFERGWSGNAQRVEVKSFRAGRVTSVRDKSARVFVEFVLQRGRRLRTGVQRSRTNLVIISGWGHPDAPNGWMSHGKGSVSARWPLFAPEWRAEMDSFLASYLIGSPAVRILADFRDDPNPSSYIGNKQAIAEGPSLTTREGGTNLQSAETTDTPDTDAWAYADDVNSTEFLPEGAVRYVVVNVYERNPEARRKCIERHGVACCACGFDFSKAYGHAMHGYIHVHHRTPLSQIGREYVIDPIADLCPICPNCHSVVHSREPPYTIEEVRRLLAGAKANGPNSRR